MLYEHAYNMSIRLAGKMKKLYLTSALVREERGHLKNIGYDGWDEGERKEKYRQDVLPYWKKFGITPKRFWFEYYGSRDHIMDPRFIPADIYYNEILPYINDGQQRPGLTNKAYLEYLFSDVKQPETVILKIEGTYYDKDRNIIDEEKAAAFCLERSGRLFLKVTFGTSGGGGIWVISPSEMSAGDIRKVFDEAGASFIVQEEIIQHPAFDKLNTSSVSTIRVISLLLEDKVYIESATLRVGSPNTPYVKVYDGGFNTEILEGGKLHPRVYSDNGKWFDNGKSLFDDSFTVPSLDRIYDEVRRIHPRMGHFKCIGWDFAVDLNGDPIMIEQNVFPSLGCAQITRCKPIFNERTDWILEDYYIRRTWAENHRQDLILQ